MKPLVLTAALLDSARSFFEDCGANGCEGTAMIKARQGQHATLVVPNQRPVRTGPGVSVEVTRRGQMDLALALSQDELYEARIHSHPGDAFHSAADDANPALTHEGALSIVVPFFGLGLRRGLDACAVLRLESSTWQNLPAGARRDRWLITQVAE